jgi:sensor histidine kinase YesM
MPNMADLKMIADGTVVKARLKNTISRRGHVGYLYSRMHQSDKVITNYGPFSIFIADESRKRWRNYSISPMNIDGRAPTQLELKSRRRYVSLEEWVKDEENLRDLAVSITDQEAGSPDQNDRGVIEDKEDELREHFGLEPIHRRATHVGKPSMI